MPENKVFGQAAVGEDVTLKSVQGFLFFQFRVIINHTKILETKGKLL